MDTSHSTLNEQQHEAVFSNSKNIMCLAGAGAGKSHTLVSRIGRLIDEGVDPRSILSLTFTNAAAFEMKQKFRRLYPNCNPCPEFRTFHSFCYSLIVKDKDLRAKLSYNSIPKVCKDTEYKRIQQEVKLQINCTLSEEKMAGKEPLSKKDQQMVELFRKALTRKLKAENLITFDMLCYNVCKLFTSHDPVVSQYHRRYKYLNVDEMQDTDRVQFQFVSSFGTDANYYFVADALQNIYQFRDCTNTYVKMLAKDPNWETIKLFKNYRSTKQICDFANKMSTYADAEYRIVMEGQRDGENVEVIPGSNTSFNCPVDTEHERILVDRLKHNQAETAILCRTNREVNEICNRLTAEKIDYFRSSKESPNLDIINSVLDNRYMIDWLSTFLDSHEYSEYIRLSSIEAEPNIRWFLSTYGSKSKIKTYGTKIIDLRKMLTDEKLTIEQKYKKLLTKFKLKSGLEDSDLEKIKNSRELLEAIKARIEEIEESKIYVGTIHSSKGLEYDTVYVMGVNDGMFELGTEEMNNLYYVAITRAKNHLTIFRR